MMTVNKIILLKVTNIYQSLC